MTKLDRSNAGHGTALAHDRHHGLEPSDELAPWTDALRTSLLDPPEDFVARVEALLPAAAKPAPTSRWHGFLLLLGLSLGAWQTLVFAFGLWVAAAAG